MKHVAWAALLALGSVLPAAARADIVYIGGDIDLDAGTANDPGAVFGARVPTYLTTVTSFVADGTNAVCAFSSSLSSALTCTGFTIDPIAGLVVLDSNAAAPITYDFSGANFGADGVSSGAGPFGPAVLVIGPLPAPGAPAPLLGLGLLPALAAGGGLLAARRRRRVAALA